MSKRKSKGSNVTRGARNNNPGNLEWGSPWQGLRPESERTDDRFCQFISATYGIRALACVLITYQDKRRAKDGSRIDSVREFIERWAPPNENDTTSYSASVAALLDGVGPADEVIDVHNYDHLRPLVEGIIRHENGRGPSTKTPTAGTAMPRSMKACGERAWFAKSRLLKTLPARQPSL
ncbi:hypothetical protein ACSZNO_21460 [Aeromonas veronii]